MEDKVMPEGKWEFDEEVAQSFDDMLTRSIPQYDVMRNTVTEIARRYITANSVVIDIGCARGEAIAPLVHTFPSARFLGLEYSAPMVAAARERFRENVQNTTIIQYDLRKGIPRFTGIPSVVMSVLTIQFIPIEYRQMIIQSIYDVLPSGGVFILVEKVLGETAAIDRLMTEIYLDMKKENGYTQEQIDRKKLSLEGVLVPVTAAWNENLLRMAGFKKVDCFWRWMNFAGWVGLR